MRKSLTIIATAALLCLPLASDRPLNRGNLNGGISGKFSTPNLLTMDALEAERSQAHSAASMVRLTWYQLILSTAGTLALIVTLGFTRQAIRQTSRSIAHAEQTAKRQVRAYLDIEFHDVIGLDPDAAAPNIGDNPAIRIAFRLKNRGQTPARNIALCHGWQVLPGWTLALPPPFPLTNGFPLKDLPPASETKCFMAADGLRRDRLIEAFNSKKERVAVWIRIEYTDAFEDTQWLEFSAFLYGNPPKVDHHNTGYQGGS